MRAPVASKIALPTAAATTVIADTSSCCSIIMTAAHSCGITDNTGSAFLRCRLSAKWDALPANGE